jgi:hypothetical protein
VLVYPLHAHPHHAVACSFSTAFPQLPRLHICARAAPVTTAVGWCLSVSSTSKIRQTRILLGVDSVGLPSPSTLLAACVRAYKPVISPIGRPTGGTSPVMWAPDCRSATRACTSTIASPHGTYTTIRTLLVQLQLTIGSRGASVCSGFAGDAPPQGLPLLMPLPAAQGSSVSRRSTHECRICGQLLTSAMKHGIQLN